MKIQFLVAAGALAALAGGASAQVLYDNGPLATGPTSKSGVPAPAGTQWSECQAEGAVAPTQANTSAGFLADVVDGPDTRVSDNFTVPAGQTWNVNGLRFWGYQTGAGQANNSINGVNARIWNGRPGDAGATVVWSSPGFPATVTPTGGFANIFRIFNTIVPPASAPGTTRAVFIREIAVSGLSLTAGTYWVDWQFAGTVASGPWVPTVTRLDTRYPFPNQGAGNARQFFTGAWQDIIDTGQPAGAADAIQQELVFAVLGSQGSTCRPDLNNDGELTFDDIQFFVSLYNSNDPRADFNNDQEWTFDDIQLFIQLFNAGC
jgi:hypothetical protein